MLTLHTFGPMFGLPDPSPFVSKADVLLKMSGVAYQTKSGGLRGAPKGKLPYIDDDGEKIADSTFIRLHLERKYRIDFDAHLSAVEKAIAWSVEKMLEDHLYWAIVSARWMDDANFSKGPSRFFDGAPAVIRPLITNMIRRSVRKTLHGHGLGRHSDVEISTLANRTIDAVAVLLGDKPYLMGEKKCGADATAYAFLLGTLCSHFDTPIRTHAERHKNVVSYCERLSKEFYPTLQ
jgi:glutathione S-transferase